MQLKVAMAVISCVCGMGWEQWSLCRVAFLLGFIEGHVVMREETEQPSF